VFIEQRNTATQGTANMCKPADHVMTRNLWFTSNTKSTDYLCHSVARELIAASANPKNFESLLWIVRRYE
jgi:hypothetical protein